jgi:hypothetical protein
VTTALLASQLLLASPRALAAAPFAGCAPAPPAGAPIAVVVGTVACQQMTTQLLGPGIAAPFGYYVPPDCAPARRVRCPVLYLLHGFGGDYTEMVGTAAQPSAWVASLTSGPPAGFEAAPWTFADTRSWVSRSRLAMILVAPLGQTLPGGYGPRAGLDSYWTDWNPRYGAGGDQPRYRTPPPGFETFLTQELVPFVESRFPAGSGRQWRALGGVSLGGFGAYKNGLQHPDEWTSMLSVSGAHNFLFAPGLDPAPVISPLGAQPPVALPYLPLTGPTGAVPAGGLPPQASTFLTALDALGDPVADQAYFRGNTPRDLALNARASASGVSSFGIDGFVNDTVPRRAQDVGDVTAQAFEDIVLPMNIDMQLALADERVPNTFAVHQGLHSDTYRNAWLRGLEEFAYARLQHADGGGGPPPLPTAFDYRSIRTDFEVWGWHVHVTRRPVEFLTLRSVSCHGLTLQGTGKVDVTVPAPCGNRQAGRTFTVDLGPSMPVDEPGGAGALPTYGRSVILPLG